MSSQMTDNKNLNEKKLYNSIDDLMKSKDNVLKTFLSKAKMLSGNIKNIEVDEDTDYLISQSKDYKELTIKANKKVESLINKILKFANNKKAKNINIKK